MKPILFNTEMVRAILDGRKSVTRRMVKPQPEGAHTVLECNEDEHTFDLLCGNGGAGGIFVDWSEIIKAPYWPGDILYVRETWAFDTGDDDEEGTGYFAYKADGSDSPTGRWRPSIHMPKEAARLFLRVTDVWVERLQDISRDDTVAEGTPCRVRLHGGYCGNGGLCDCEDYKQEFAALWDSTIPKDKLPIDGWDANPWVWAYRFERISKDEAQKGGEGK